MRKIFFLISYFILTQISFGQNPPQKEYFDLFNKADSLFKAKEFKSSALTYSLLFKLKGWDLFFPSAEYNAAHSWALANNPDSAFNQLNRIMNKNMNSYYFYSNITNDPDLKSLHKDKRWKPFVEMVKINKDKEEAKLNKYCTFPTLIDKSNKVFL